MSIEMINFSNQKETTYLEEKKPYSNDKRCLLSYRPKKAKHSEFIDIKELIAKKDKKTLIEVYKQFSDRIYSYIETDQKDFKSLEKANARLYRYFSENKLKNEKIISKKTPKQIAKKIQKAIEIAEKKITIDLPEEVQEILNGRLNDKDQEFQRLIQNSRIEKFAKKIGIKFSKKVEKSRTKKAFILWAQSVELQEKLKDNYYVFNHGQVSALITVNIIYTELMRNCGGVDKKDQHYIRLPDLLDKKEISFFKEVIKNYKNKAVTERAFTRSVDDVMYSEELLCVDNYLESRRDCESAWFYFLHNKSEKTRSAMGEYNYPYLLFSDKAVDYYFQNSKVNSKLKKKFSNVEGKIPSLRNPETLGSLYTILIPKNKFVDAGYISHAWGDPYEEGKFSLDELQGTVLKGNPPQVRLSTWKVVSDPEIITLVSHNLSQKSLDRLEKGIDTEIKKAIHLRKY